MKQSLTTQNNETNINEDKLALDDEFPLGSTVDLSESTAPSNPGAPSIPAYLEDTYWWAYLHPRAIWLFERKWLVNLILWGNMRRLTQTVLDEIDCAAGNSVLQVACVYGDFSNRLASHLQPSRSRLHIIDIAPIQLRNARKKLDPHETVSLHHQDSSRLQFGPGQFSHTVVYFLLHEQPEIVRRKTIAEAIRVTQPGGKVVFVDYHGPNRSNPLRYLMSHVLRWLEPFALDLWRNELPDYLPQDIKPEQVRSEFYCDGLYQKVVIAC
ncbi:MAG TPA: rhodoquinone biosynthesis methyltransferase RquA [Xanthomonadales bacterium]|nr:rhodoquinone biosynthesis methyltransferase RquA [Xanthomonadales bacterium]